MTTHPDSRSHIPRRIDPTDPQFHLYQALKAIRAGLQTRAPGIKRCRDCQEPWIDDHTGLSYCPLCRGNHHHKCEQCGTRFRNTEAGDRLCESCQHQTPLF